MVNTILIILATGWFAIHVKEKSSQPSCFIFCQSWWHIPNSDFSAFTMNNFGQYINRLPTILMLLGKQLFYAIEQWGLHWWLFVISLALKGLRQEARWQLFLLVLLPIAALSFAFILSSWQPFTAHIDISLERLILHTMLLAWYLIALQATGLNQWLTSTVNQA